MKLFNSFSSRLLTITLALMASVATFAYDFQEDGLFYTILPDGGSVAVTCERIGKPYTDIPSNLVIPEKVSQYGGRMKYRVTEIDSYAFHYCEVIESVVIPNTVKKIGMYAFIGCSKLVDISFPDILEDVQGGTFNDCAWYNNQPDGPIYIGKLLYRYKGIAPADTIIVQDGTKAVLDFAFTSQPNIQSVVLPESVESVGMMAFSDCPNLESVTLPTYLSVIENFTFQNCEKLTTINLPMGLASIGKDAFNACRSLTKLEWPLQLKSIGIRAFADCVNLDNVEAISPNIQKIYQDAFLNTAWENRQPKGYLYIHNIFYAYTGEAKEGLLIDIRPGTTYISGGAVTRCVVPINPYSVKNVVAQVIIPSSVTEIEDFTFHMCYNLDSIICAAIEPPVIGENTFNEDCQKNKHTLLVPLETYDIDYAYGGKSQYAYAPYWERFATIKPNDDPSVYDPMYFARNGIQYHITNDTLAPYEVEVTHRYGLDQWDMEGHNYPELTEANIPATIEYKGKTYAVTRVGKMAFYHASQLQRVTIGENVKIIDERAFAVCRNLSQVVIGENVDSILHNAFASGTSKIKVLDIPKNVKFIENQSLSAYSLEAINVHPDNANYTSVDGVLFNKQKNYLQEFPRSKATTYMIPDCVDTIGNLAFASNHNIVSISFSPNSQLKHIEKEAFMGCLFIQRLELPASLQSIEERAFNNCCSLEAITSLNPTPPVMSNWYNYTQQVFGSVSQDIPLFVPAESVELYDAAPQWDRFATILPIGTITMNDFPTLAGLQRTSFNANTGTSLLSAEMDIRYIEDKAYLNFQGFFLREENKQVLIYSRQLEKDLILYDYSLEVGDTLTTLNFDYRHENIPLTDLLVDYPFTDWYDVYHSIDTLTVTDISYIKLLDGKEYKQWTFNNGMQYVEGIGQFGQTIWAGDFFALIRKTPEEKDHLVCVSRNGQLLYQMTDEEMEQLGTQCLCDVNLNDNAKDKDLGGRPTPTQWFMLEEYYRERQNLKKQQSVAPAENAETFVYELLRDTTIINGKKYLPLICYSTIEDDTTTIEIGALHFNNNRVYFFYDNAEHLLYDFNASVGDTLTIFAGINNYPQDVTYPHVVTYKHVSADGSATITLNAIQQTYENGKLVEKQYEKVWISGLGSIDGIVHNSMQEISNKRITMLCAWLEDECIYSTYLPTYNTLGCVYNSNTTTAIEDIQPVTPSYQKLLRDGQLLIIHEGKTYNVMGIAVE